MARLAISPQQGLFFIRQVRVCERGKMCGRENKGGKNCPKSQDVASKELSKLLTDQLYQGHVISK